GPAYAVSSSVHTWAVAHDLCCHCHPGYGQHLDPDAFPTRRSSDLGNGSLYSRSSILNSERVTLSYMLTILFSNFRRRSDIEKSSKSVKKFCSETLYSICGSLVFIKCFRISLCHICTSCFSTPSPNSTHVGNHSANAKPIVAKRMVPKELFCLIDQRSDSRPYIRP